MNAYGVEQVSGVGGRPAFRWFDWATQGEPKPTLVEAHLDARISGREHGGVEVDRLLGADLWGSYLHACGVLGRRPDVTAHNPTMRTACLLAATSLYQAQKATVSL